MLKNIKFLYNRWAIATFDITMVMVSWVGAFWVRHNLEFDMTDFVEAISLLPVIVPIQAFSIYYFKLNKGFWRYTSLFDLVRIVRSVLIGVSIAALVLFLTNRLDGIPRSVFPIHIVSLICILSGARIAFRKFVEAQNIKDVTEKSRVLVVGAGYAGESITRDMLRDVDSKYLPVAVVDDDKRKYKRELHRIPVMGAIADIPDLVNTLDIDLVFIAIPSATSSQMRTIYDMCEQSHVPVQTLPSLSDLASGHVSVERLRNLSIEDLLGRAPVYFDDEKVTNSLDNQVVLVTGAAGSIGKELTNQLLSYHVQEIICLDHSEFALFQLEQSLQSIIEQTKISYVLQNITDRDGIASVLQRYKPDIIFHAAAYKHVPILEQNIRVGVINNVLGTKVIAEEASHAGVSQFIFISTDKAVNPVNVLGYTKRAAEIYCTAINAVSKTNFSTVRFGNVLGSTGSVIPIFQRLIENNLPVTVTHPKVKRYFMTITEACNLVIKTVLVSKGGELFVLDMGEQISITHLAEQMIKLSGNRASKSKIIYTGLREGEKLEEELLHDFESVSHTAQEKIMQCQVNPMSFEHIQKYIKALEVSCNDIAEQQLHEILHHLCEQSAVRHNQKSPSHAIEYAL